MSSRTRFLVLATLALLVGGAAAVGSGVVAPGATPLRLATLRGEAPTPLLTQGDASAPAPGLDGAHGFGAVGLVDGDARGGEPGVDLAPDGRLYVNAPSGIGNSEGSYLWRSADGGASWTKCDATTGPGGGDSNVAINPQGTIAMNDLWLGSLTFYVSTDGCASWTTVPVSTPVPVGDRQWVDYGAGACEFYQSWNQIPTGVRVQRTRDCGLTWTDTLATSSVDLIGNLLVDHSGRTANVYQLYTAGGGVYAAVGKVTRTLAGETLSFTRRTVAAPESGHETADSFPAGAIDAAGNLHVVWQDRVGQSSRIAYAYSTDAGQTWSAPRIISTGGSNVFPWIDAGAAGKVNAVWYHADQSGDPNDVPGPWYVHLSQSLALGGAWTESRATATSVHNDVICTGGTSCGSDDRDLADFFEVAHDAAGYAVIAFTKDTDASGNGNGDPLNAFVRQTSGATIL